MTDYGIIQEFIREHGKEDTQRLLLSKGKWPQVDMDTVVGTIEGRKRMAKKVPSWSDSDLIYPGTLCTEQCSSEATALVKARIAGRIVGKGYRIADLTGGIGVDSWAFAEGAEAVLHNEANEVLSEAVEYNFRKLGRDNVSFTSFLVVPDNIPEEGNSRHIKTLLGEFRPDIIFLDPARRSETGKKVFLLEDCSPDVIPLLPSLLEEAPEVLMKLSPMADIPMVISRLQGNISEVHVVGSEGECKELLLRISRGHEGGITLFVHDGGRTITLPYEMEKSATPTFLNSPEELAGLAVDGGLLFIPGKAISKAGLFNWTSKEWEMPKAAPSSHLYFIPGGNPVPDEVPCFGRIMEIAEILPFSSSSLKSIGKRYKKADVLAKDVPITSEQLSKKMGVSSGGEMMIVGTRVHFGGDSSKDDNRFMIICRKRH